jgi:NAD(P)-dependent dehydrogenase (short-subunit alcohol dehydrogenase family)
MSTIQLYDLTGTVAVITGGAGLLGRRHAEAVLEAGGTAVLLDVSPESLAEAAHTLREQLSGIIHIFACDITSQEQVERVCEQIINQAGRVDILINNAANNPKVEAGSDKNFSRLENFPLDVWNRDIAVGLTGAMLCSRIFASAMRLTGGGVILNIASDLALIAPDQRLYRQDGLPNEEQPVKPVSYSAVKAGLLGLTRYCATYYAKDNIRCNALAPGGVYTNQSDEFVTRLTNLIPMSRMAKQDEYKGAVLFLISGASSYMTGACLPVDGGRSCW